MMQKDQWQESQGMQHKGDSVKESTVCNLCVRDELQRDGRPFSAVWQPARPGARLTPDYLFAFKKKKGGSGVIQKFSRCCTQKLVIVHLALKPVG